MRTEAHIRERLTALWHRLRPFAPYLTDPAVQEIAVNRPGEIALWKNGVWSHVSMPELDFNLLESIADDLANYVDKPFDRQHTDLDAHLPSRERIIVTGPPTSPEGVIQLNIRKHVGRAIAHAAMANDGYYANTRHDHALSLTQERRDDLAKYLTAEEKELWSYAKNNDWENFMRRAVALKQNIVVSGSTGSGKTTYLRALIGMVKQSERIITVEDTPEMPLWDIERPEEGHRHSKALFYRKDSEPGEPLQDGANIESVIRSVMRKTPMRVILAELRGPEAMFFMSGVLNSGHSGMTTVHCGEPRDAYERIALLIKSSPTGQGIDMTAIKTMLYMSINIVVQLKFDDVLGRYVSSIYYDPMYRLSLLA